MKKSFSKIAALFVFLCCFVVAFGQKITLVTGNKSPYIIIIPVHATAIEQQAASQLQYYIHCIAGVQLPIFRDNRPSASKEILIGHTARMPDVDYASLGQDGILIQTTQQKLLLTGGNRKGVLYSVYTFLETYLGCRKYAKNVDFIPSIKTIALPDNIYNRQIPSFVFRSTYSLEGLDTAYADWHKLNYFFEDYGSYAHTFQLLMPPKEYFKRHPEYFALLHGSRSPDQPCLSNSNVFAIMKQNLQKQMSQHPEYRNWSVSQNDNLSYCEGALCAPKEKAGNGFIETLMPFVNKMANAFPNKTISTLAYNQSIEPSKFVKPAKNVEIMFCVTNINRFNPISTSNDQAATKFRNALDLWKGQTTHLFVWDYIVNYFHTIAPYPNIASIQPNLQYFKQNGITKIFEQGTGPQEGEFSELKSFLVANLLWNVHLNVDSLITSFTNAFYGPAAPEIRSYLNLLSKTAEEDPTPLNPWGNLNSHANGYLSSANLQKYRQLMNVALSKVKSNPEYYRRVMKECLAIDYAEIEIAANTINGINHLGGNKAFVQKTQNFIKEAKSVGIVFLENGENTPDQYLVKCLKKARLNH